MKIDEREARLLENFRARRWRGGVRCPRCGGADCPVHMRADAAGRRKFLCYGCGRTFNDLTGTPFARSHLPLSSWIAAARLLENETPTCARLAQRLRVKIATAWHIRRVVAAALAVPATRALLLGEEEERCD